MTTTTTPQANRMGGAGRPWEQVERTDSLGRRVDASLLAPLARMATARHWSLAPGTDGLGQTGAELTGPPVGPANATGSESQPHHLDPTPTVTPTQPRGCR
jgi:hypothetical protein